MSTYKFILTPNADSPAGVGAKFTKGKRYDAEHFTNYNGESLYKITDDEGNIELRAGRYLSENVYTDVSVGEGGRSSINLNLDITQSLRARGSRNHRPSRLASFFTVICPSTTARTMRPLRRRPARSTAIRSPSRMPSASRLSPDTRHQKVACSWRMTHLNGSTVSSRSSAAGEGKPAGT